MDSVYYSRCTSPIGEILIASTEKGLCRLDLVRNERDFVRSLSKEFDATVVRDDGRFLEMREMLDTYFAGKPIEFEVSFDLRGTDFQRRVWSEMHKIGYGRTKSYEDIAKAIGRPKAVRAVGNAVGGNPVSLMIPCHRVIRKDGTLGGFGLGLPVKKWLLKLEKVAPFPKSKDS